MQSLNECNFSEPIEVIWKVFKATRSLNQNSLMWMWNEEIRQFLVKKYPAHYSDWSVKKIHALHKHTFLGYRDEERTDIVTKVKSMHSVLISTTELDKGEMHTFMNQTYYYWADKQLFLTVPELSDYFKNERKQNE